VHVEALNYVAGFSSSSGTVIELGSRNTSGLTIRDIFAGCRFTGVDAVPGRDVDVVANAADWRPDESADMVICCELFEHTPKWRQIVANAWHMIVPGGRALFTCAGPGRAVHGLNHDDPDQPGWYQNLTAFELGEAMTAAGFADFVVREVPHRSTPLGGSDVHATGIRPWT
jgi:Methyltransferase domain